MRHQRVKVLCRDALEAARRRLDLNERSTLQEKIKSGETLRNERGVRPKERKWLGGIGGRE